MFNFINTVVTDRLLARLDRQEIEGERRMAFVEKVVGFLTGPSFKAILEGAQIGLPLARERNKESFRMVRKLVAEKGLAGWIEGQVGAFRLAFKPAFGAFSGLAFGPLQKERLRPQA